MAVLKRKSYSKILVFILQAIVMFFLFLLFVDKQTAYLIRDIIEELNINADIQSLIARLFIGFKMTFNLPSIVGFCIVILQVFFAKWVIKSNFSIFCHKFEIISYAVEQDNCSINEFTNYNNDKYLLNMRLLN